MPEIVGQAKRIVKKKALTAKRAKIIKDIILPLVVRDILNEMGSDGIGPYNRQEIREAIAALETKLDKAIGV